MKTMFILLLAVLLVSKPPVSSAAEASPVFDTANKIIRAGARYYIFSVFPRTGGLTMESLDNKTCPLDIVQEDNLGHPVSFTPIKPKKGVIRNDIDLNIQFLVPTKCSDSSWWDVEISPSTGNVILSTGGKQGNPGPSTAKNWFRILEDGRQETGGRLYKFVHCPNFTRPTCQDVGIVVQNGKRRLGLTDIPLQFVLKQSQMV